MKLTRILILVFFVVSPLSVFAQDGVVEVVDVEQNDSNNYASAAVEQSAESEFSAASGSIQKRLQDSIAELNALREQVAAEKVPLSRKLSELESKLSNIRLEYQKTTRLLDSRTLDLSNLRNDIKLREQESMYLSNLLGEYIRNFESRLHIVELQRYEDKLEDAKLAAENSNLSELDVYKAQAGMLQTSIDRLEDALGGTIFSGTATDAGGTIHNGKFILLGPSALFESNDGSIIGTAEQRLGSLEPTVIAFGDVSDAEAAKGVVSNSKGFFPLDPTQGNAHKMEETKDTPMSHLEKGGMVMYPIVGLAGVVLTIAALKAIGLFVLTRKPSRKQINVFLDSVASHDEGLIQQNVRNISGPAGTMLAAGVENITLPRELIEEVMYEKVMTIRLKLERFLPFISISAATAPLLGLLGTVTGIIKTFKMLNLIGSGDMKALSSGISEALLTTMYGLIVAIPSLLLYAFLSRRAKSIINEMEKAAVAFVNQLSKSPLPGRPVGPGDLSEMSFSQAQAVSKGLGSDRIRSAQPTVEQTETPKSNLHDTAYSLMNPEVLFINAGDTVAQAIDKIRSFKAGADIDSVFVVDDNGRYAGNVLIRHLLTRPEDVSIDTIAEKNPVFVRVDTHKDEVKDLFSKHDLAHMPVLDHEDQLIGQISRNGNGDGR